MGFKNGLKAQKLLAQGIALGIMAISKTSCKGKSLVYCPVIPRAMPWARSFCPFRACGAFLIASALYLFLRPVTVVSGRVELTCET